MAETFRIRLTHNTEVTETLNRPCWGIYTSPSSMLNKDGQYKNFWSIDKKDWRSIYYKTRREAIMIVKKFFPKSKIKSI